MTSPVTTVQVKCPKCGKEYETSYRASFNLSLGDNFDEEYMHRLTHGVCPGCGTEVDLGALIVDREGAFNFRASSKPRRRAKK